MDRGTRIYLYVLLVGVASLVFFAAYQPAKVRELNARLAADRTLAAYPYPFRVLEVADGTARMSSPRSADMPVAHMIGAIHPRLKNRPVDDPAFVRAQQALADHQSRAKRLVLADSAVHAVRWQLDESWLSRHGVIPRK